ncbi:MAG: hypothetical protein KME57_25075 [Scytonema hyalinum WJT4-NPBG1]|nr:hypothetical protein [Scytonema hyalinum WJT4-NPBG1]
MYGVVQSCFLSANCSAIRRLASASTSRSCSIVRFSRTFSAQAIASGETPYQYQRSLLEKSLVNTSDRF